MHVAVSYLGNPIATPHFHLHQFYFLISTFTLLVAKQQGTADCPASALYILLIHNVQDVLTSREFAVCPKDQRLKQVHVLFSGPPPCPLTSTHT